MDYHPLDNFGARLCSARKSMDLNQITISNNLGCSNGAFSLYEKGRRQPSLNVLFDFCDKYGGSADYLLGCFSPPCFLFAERLSYALAAHSDKSLVEFCDLNELDHSAALLLCSGTHFPNAKIFANLCRYLDCSADYLIGLSDNMSGSSSFSMSPSFVPRSPLDDLDDDLRARAEGYIASLRDIQRERTSDSKQEA